MLRDEGGRKADEDSQIYILDRPPSHLADDSPPPMVFEPFDAEPAANPVHRPESSPQAQPEPPAQGGPAPRQAVIVGLAKATAERNRRKRNTGQPPAQAQPGLAPERLPPAQLPPDQPHVAGAPMFIDSSTDLMSDGDAALARQSAPPPAPVPHAALPVQRAEDATNLVEFDPRELMHQAEVADEPTAAMSIEDLPDLAANRPPPRQPPPPRQTGKRMPSPVVSDRVSLDTPSRLQTADAVLSSDSGSADGPTRQVDLQELLGEKKPPAEDPTKAVDLNRRADMEARIHSTNADGQVQDDATRALELSERPSTLSDVDWDLD
jgi:hypothetical protein